MQGGESLPEGDLFGAAEQAEEFGRGVEAAGGAGGERGGGENCQIPSPLQKTF